LQGKGYSTIEAADGEEALEIFRQHSDSISLIISDLVMPKLGGRQLAAALREAGSTVPILFTSGYSPGSGLEEQALPPGVAFLMKPWSLSDLFGKVREMLDPRDVQVR
jgi:CheY-like chemotaxis protein